MSNVKKLFAVIFAVMAVMLMSTAVFAETYTGNLGNCTYSFDSASGELTLSGKGSMNTSAFWMNNAPFNIRDVRSVVITEGITEIGNEAFVNFTNMDRVVIPEGVTYIGESAFENCTRLKNVELPSTLDRIASKAFKNSGLIQIVLPDNVRSIGSYSFWGCKNLTSMELNNSIQNIFDCTYNTGLTHITIPKDVKYIADCAFGYNYANYEDIPVENFIIYGAEGSKAQTYAENNGFKFITLPTVKVSFDTRNKCTAPEDQVFLFGARAAAVEDPYLEGYAFDGWYYDSDLTQKFDFGDRITKDTTLYAKWDEVSTGAVSFTDNDDVVTLYYGDDAVFNANFDSDTRLMLAADYTDKDGNEYTNVSLAVGNVPLTVKFSSGKYGRVFSPDNKSVTVRLLYFNTGWKDTHFVRIKTVYKPGDVNIDGTADEKDVTAILKNITKTQLIYGDALKRANMNNDGVIDMLDAVKITEIIEN